MAKQHQVLRAVASAMSLAVVMAIAILVQVLHRTTTVTVRTVQTTSGRQLKNLFDGISKNDEYLPSSVKKRREEGHRALPCPANEGGPDLLGELVGVQSVYAQPACTAQPCTSSRYTDGQISCVPPNCTS